jgi:hypothetical protein
MAESIDPLLQRPIIIVGAPRSGTTLLGNILRRHPALAYLVEPRLTWRYGNDRRSDALRPEHASDKVRQHIRAAFAEAVEQADRQRLLEKTPSNSLRMGFVDCVLPGCQFVHIMRDGVESVLSIHRYWQQHAQGIKPEKVVARLGEIDWRRAPYYAREVVRRTLPRGLARFAGQPVWGPRLPGIDALLSELDLLEVCCLQWRACVEAACQYGRQLSPERYFECRLEQMSPALVRSILEFTGLDDSREVWTAFETEFDPALPAGRSRAADQGDIERIRRWIEPTMEWLGDRDQ